MVEWNKRLDLKLDVVQYKEANEAVESFFEEYGSVFHTHRFLSAVGSHYVCLAAMKGETIYGALPLVETRKNGLKGYHIPPYSYQFGPIIHPDYHDKARSIIGALLAKLPKSGHYDFKLFIETPDIISFNKFGFSVSVNQTHVFDKSRSYEYSCLSKDKRRDVRKLKRAVDEGGIKVIENDPGNIDKILYLWKQTAKRSGFSSHLRTLSTIMETKISYYSNVIQNKSGDPISGTFCPFDANTMYHLIGAGVRVEDNLQSRSNILSLYLAVLKANEMELCFDFEGSNVPGIAKFYRMMGGQPKLIYRAQKTKSIYYQVLRLGDTYLRERK